MAYLIKFFHLSGLVGSEHSTASLVGARRVAVDAVDSGAARRAEVRDQDGNLIFKYPDPEFS